MKQRHKNLNQIIFQEIHLSFIDELLNQNLRYILVHVQLLKGTCCSRLISVSTLV